jgi:hypothetical protein
VTGDGSGAVGTYTLTLSSADSFSATKVEGE